MLNRLVELSLRYKFLVLIVFAVVAFLGINASPRSRSMSTPNPRAWRPRMSSSC
jgi:Cu/Ag efflux pump CusA